MNSIDRRSLMQRALVLAGAFASSIPSFEALADTPQLLDASRFALLSSVADTMIPRTSTAGAIDAGVPKLLDGLLRKWASAESRKMLLGALDEIDGVALTADKVIFAGLAPERRLALLKEHDERSLKASPTPANPGYAKLKELIVVLYYMSEPALTQELVYEHSPGEWKPSIPMTPETRAWGGIGYY